MRLIYFLNKQWVILTLAFVLALLAGDFAKYIKPAVMPVVMAVMVLSASSFNPSDLLPLSRSIRFGAAGFFWNYVLLSGVVLVVSTLLVTDPDLRAGFVMVALSPPGVAIVPFTFLMGGRIIQGVVGTFGAFVGSIAAAPLIAAWLIGSGSVGSGKMVVLLIQAVIIPFIAARILMRSKTFNRMLTYRGTMINWGMFLITFTSVGLNSSTFYEHPRLVLDAVAVSIISIFGTAFIVEIISKKAGLNREKRIPLMLLSTIKNGGFAVVAAMAIAGERASVSAAVFSGFTAIFLVYLSARDKWKPF
ncbi:MAG: hypothetical protein JNL74_00670 [Fibrobacteres bacterium]|nr:hypothetical protein [Fibrobacterota bacterium]